MKIWWSENFEIQVVEILQNFSTLINFENDFADLIGEIWIAAIRTKKRLSTSC